MSHFYNEFVCSFTLLSSTIQIGVSYTDNIFIFIPLIAKRTARYTKFFKSDPLVYNT